MSSVSRDWSFFKKGSIGKTAGLMTPYEDKPAIMFRANKFAYMSKKMLHMLGDPDYIMVGVEGKDVCIKPCLTPSEGYKVHGTNGGAGQSAYVDLSLFVKEYGVHMGLYECDVEDGTLVFNLRDFKPAPEPRNWHSKRLSR